MELRITDLGAGILLGLQGDLDIASVPQAKLLIAPLLADGASRFLLDLSQVEHVDTTGLGFLVWLRKRCTEAGGGLQLAGHNPHFQKLLDLTGLRQILELVDDVGSASEALKSASAS